jgi:hypothetical protein
VIRAEGHRRPMGIDDAGLGKVNTLRQQQGSERQPGDPTNSMYRKAHRWTDCTPLRVNWAFGRLGKASGAPRSD